jgi:hypothetical protein
MTRTQDFPVGLCSRKRAEHLMGAAAVAGGAIFVGIPEIRGVTVGRDNDWRGFLCCGRLPSGDAVPRRLLNPATVLAALDVEITRTEPLAPVYAEFATQLAGLRTARDFIAARVTA